MSEAERAPFIAASDADKERYKREMEKVSESVVVAPYVSPVQYEAVGSELDQESYRRLLNECFSESARKRRADVPVD
jgi:hypothetical protein